VSTACLPGTVPLSERLEDYASQALFGVELGAGVSRSGLVEALDEARSHPRWEFLVHNYFPPPLEPFVLNLASAGPSIRDRSLSLARSAIDLCSELGARAYSVHGGFITDPSITGEGVWVFPAPKTNEEGQAALRRFIDSIRVLLDYAVARGVQLHVENNVCPPELSDRLLFVGVDDFLELFRAFRPEAPLGILLDTGHLRVSAATHGFDRREFIECLGERIEAVHLHDNDGSADNHEPVRPGSWVFDFLVRDEFPSVPITVEAKFAGVSELKEHVDWLTNALDVR